MPQMTGLKTPGVYIDEESAFPNSVVEVPTAVPAFIGYTEKASVGNTSLAMAPTPITSMAEYQQLFGGPAPLSVTANKTDPTAMVAQNRFLMYQSLQFFYANGGGSCWVVSIGGYDNGAKPPKPTTLKAADFVAGIATLETQPEPTMVLTPDSISLALNDWANVTTTALQHCGKMQSRIAILDVWNGNTPLSPPPSPIDAFRDKVGTNFLSYGVAYYPWLNTSLLDGTSVTFLNLDAGLRKSLAAKITANLTAAFKAANRGPLPSDLTTMIKMVESGTPQDDNSALATHQAMLVASLDYKQAMAQALQALNLMPPSAAMAGIYTMTDNTVGVWKAPANTSVAYVTSPTVSIGHDAQEDLNVPIFGKAVNAIRSFIGRGVLVWGARTLDGNSQDWRYISVRRTLIMLEQSIKNAAEAYVFAPNDAGTWVTVQGMIENFLNNQWKAGALAGATPAEAYQVSVGLGSTMTANDILDGYMRVTVLVAVTHPAEFIVLTFEQKMQTS